VAKDRIKILGGWSAWAEPVLQGRLIRPDGEAIWVLMRRRPELEFSPDEWKVQKANSRLISRVDHPSVLRLLHAATIDGAPAWIHEGFQGVSLERVLAVYGAEGQFLSARAAVETVQRAIQGLRAAISQGSNLPGAHGNFCHPGPAPSELLIDAVGAVKLAGFGFQTESVKLPEQPGYVPHVPGSPEQRGAYGVAALLVHLLGGERPGEAGSDADRQSAVIRRAMIRVLARPGEAVPESVVELIKSGLAFDPDERPEFTEIEDELARSASQLRSESLRVWAPATVPGLLKMQEEGYPDPSSGRIRRHIDLADDSSSYEAPPVRAPSTDSAPREVATVMAKVDVAAAVEAASEDNSRETIGAVSQTSFASIPTSETDVKLALPTVLGTEPEAPVPVVLDIGDPDDTWEIELEVEGRMGGWPLVAGLLIGMVIAAIVGWVVVEQMGQQMPETQATVAEPSVLERTPSVVEPVAPPVAEENADSGEAPNVPEEADNEEDIVSPTAEPIEAPVAVPVADNAPAEEEQLRPTRTPPAPARTAPPAPVPAEFRVSFRNASPTIDRIIVKCHKGGVSEGAELVYIDRAGKGPCRVEGYDGTEKVAVSAVLMGPHNFTCFEGNARVCR